MFDYRPILFVIGVLLATFGGSMALPALADIFAGSPDWKVFLLSAGTTFFVGTSLALANRGTGDALTLKQAFILTTLAWVLMPAFAAVPFVYSEIGLSYADAYFEAMSGVTTTGSTVITGLDNTNAGILLWRALLQWLGGIGIVVMAVAVLPMLRVGGMQLFRMESSDTSEKIMPRVAQIAGAFTWIYIGLSVVCMVALIWAGMPAFDAAAHAMTTIATGGFSTSDGSVGAFESTAVDAIIITFMLVGSLPFVLLLQAVRGKPLALWRDRQVQAFLGTALLIVLMVILWLMIFKGMPLDHALRFGTFNVVSIMTGTGYTTTDYGAWGAFSTTLFFTVMFIGGCAGSTSCGIKIFRFQVLFSAMRSRMLQINHPHGVFVPHYNRRPIPDQVISSVMSFMFLFLVSFLFLALAVAATGVDFVTAVSSAGTALANVGPGLGPVVGPAGTFQPLPDSAKWILSFGMLLGRLELFTVLVLLTPGFWRA